MKNTFKLSGITAVIAVIAVFAGCTNPADDGSGGNTHTHSFGAWQANAAQHWKECSCGEEYGRANHTGDPCNVCGYASGNTQETAPAITTATLPNGVAGTAYSQTLAATGTAPITWSLESGALPAGLTLSGNGAISGMPATAATSTFTVKATNAKGSAAKALSITVLPAGSSLGTAPTITTATLPNGAVGTAYSQTLAATGDAPITWNLENGTLPTGLSLSGNGAISGTPATAATSNFTVKATNSAGVDTKALSITIAGGGTPTTYTVTFNANGATSGTAPAAMTVTAGQKITLPSAGSLAKTGAFFGGWNTDADGWGTNYSAGSSYTVSRTVTLYAKWDAIMYTVTFNANGGSGAVDPITVYSGESITLPYGEYDLNRVGYTFIGWNTNASGTGTNYGSGSSYSVYGDVALFAHWELTSYTVTFDLNDMSGPTAPSPRTVEPGNSITLLDIGTQSLVYASFAGWNTKADGSGAAYAAYSSYTPTGNITAITLYAQWDIVPFSSITGFENKLRWLQAHAQSDTSYTVEADSDESISPKTFSYSNRNNITVTLTGVGANRTISDGGFAVGSGVTLVLDNNITLRRSVSVGDGQTGGTLIMNDGSAVTGNNGRGVSVYGGTFTMNGGTISSNSVTSSSTSATAIAVGGVSVSGSGTFTMNGGTISGNTAAFSSPNATAAAAGGVHVYARGTFTMNGGTISGNTPGGVLVGVYYSDGSGYGTFNMSGGTISDNGSNGGVSVLSGTFTMSGTAKITGNTASVGGGVSVGSIGVFTMNGGTISGNTASHNGGGVMVSGQYIQSRYERGTFTMSGGTISGNTANVYDGGGVHVGQYGDFAMSGGTISGNTARRYGGGVFVDSWYGTFNKTGGTVTGYLGDSANGNVVKDTGNNILNDRGHAVALYGYSSLAQRKETTAGPGDNLNSNGSGAWDY